MEPTIKGGKHLAENADISGSRFHEVNLSGADFDDVNLSQARFHNINLSDIQVTAVQIGGATFKHIGPPPDKDGHQARQRPVMFEEAMLGDSTFLKVDLSNVRIIDCNIQGMTIDGILVTDLLKGFRKRSTGQKARAMKPQVLVTADPARKLLQLSFAGEIGLKEIEYYESAVESTLATMPPGFHLLTDLTDLQSMDLVCVPYIKRTMDRLHGHGVARIVRVIPDRRKDIGFSIMSLFHYPHGISIVTCENKVDAERALE
jgi:hypothetical protein